MHKISLPTKRDDVNLLLQTVFLYATNLQATKMLDANGPADKINVMLVSNLIADVNLLLRKKLVNCQKTQFTLKLTEVQAITLLQVLQQFPIEADQFYFIFMRNNLIDILYQQIL